MDSLVVTRTDSMFQPFLLADAPPASWLGALYGFASAAALGLVTWLLQRQSARADGAIARERRTQEGDSAVEIENIRSLQDLQKQRSADNAALRLEITQLREHGDRQCRHLEQKLSVLTSAYYQLHSVTVLLQQGWRTMRARLKRTDPHFDESEFPDLSIDKLDPLKLFAQMDRTTNVTVVSSPTDPNKQTTITTDKPHDDEP